MKNKRGLSAVIATVLIIAITVAAVGIIANFSVPFVKEGLEKSTECVDYQEHFKFSEELGFNCYQGNDDLILSVSSKNLESAEEDIRGFNFVLFGDGFSKVVEVRPGESYEILQMYTPGDIEVPGPGETLSYRYTEGETYQFSELFPVLESGKVCDRRSDRISLRRCG